MYVLSIHPPLSVQLIPNSSPGLFEIKICPQSAYKIHPDFIEIIGNILTQVPNSHLVLLQARKQGWTEMLQNRMIYKLTTEVYERIHFVPRTDSASFLQLIGSADIMLHPFPFGGSKTSADGIAAAVGVCRWLRN